MTDTAPLVSIPEAPVPDNGTAEWFSGAGAYRLRAALFLPPASVNGGTPRGSVVLSGGRTEPIEKYFEVIGELQARGFVVLAHDWRGQGLSQRLLDDPLKGHAHGFADFVEDYRRLLAHFGTRLPKPWIAVGHSMGGCLTLLAIAHGAGPFKAAVLSAPMLGLQTGNRPKRAARALAWLMGRTKPTDYILGDSGEGQPQTFETNILTHDARRYARNLAQVAAEPGLKLNAGTWGWLDFAFSASAWLKRDPAVARIAIPVVVLAAGEERLVDNADQREITARIPQGRWVEVPGSYHEILQETDPIRAVFWREFDAVAAGV
ncbi:MAG: alpha/beta hydrolase [Caulobacter sp.]|nr:alpha/beta hydrolase [Caulobacter sp.]